MRRIHWGIAAFSILGIALLCGVGASCLPDNPYQRFQLVDGTIYQTLRWTYERIHFDPKPVDVAIVGPSRSQLGLSAARIEKNLSSLGKPANVANFSIIGDGRNVEWAIVNELYKTKSPKIIVIGIDEKPYPYGHPAFKYVAPSSSVAIVPTPFLHDYFYGIVYLPFRQLKLFGAMLFPNTFGVSDQFDPARYANTPSDFTYSHRIEDGKWIDMDKEVPREVLLEQFRKISLANRHSRLSPMINKVLGGDDHAYIQEISRLAKSHGTQLVFVYMPMFGGPTEIEDRAFLEKYGVVISNGDLAQQSTLFEGWAHFNHAGAEVASDRLATEIARLTH